MNDRDAVEVRLDYIEKENEAQWEKLTTLGQKVDKIISRLTWSAVSFAIMSLLLALNLFMGKI